MRIVILAAKGEKANILYHTLAERYDVCKVFLEESVPKRQLLMRRIHKMGIRKVMGQILFKVVVVKKLERTSQRRIARIKEQYAMNNSKIPSDCIEEVSNINDASCIAHLQEMHPDLIIVNGTRILSKEILQAVKVPFLNMHAGITPLYRGVHGGYWALAEQDKEHCGVTVHLIDEGIDTGSVLYQSIITITEEDNFVTYPYLQFALGLQDMIRAIEDAEQKVLHPIQVDLPSKFRTHPTLAQYRYYKKQFGVR
ncbi:MAG: formyl transferase [Lachnospiraceae bacterium]